VGGSVGTKVKVAEAVAVDALVGVLDRVCVAVGILVGGLDGGAVRVEMGFIVGDFEGAVICVGAFVGFDTLAVGVTIVGEKDLVAELAGLAAGGASFVSPKLINATVDAKRRKLIPNNQRAPRIYPRRERKLANLRLACRVRIPNP
jgi:hypothetical protein